MLREGCKIEENKQVSSWFESAPNCEYISKGLVKSWLIISY